MSGILVMQPAYRIWIDELWSEFGRLLLEGNPDQLRNLSELVWRNTSKPLKVHGQMTPRDWAKSATGRNLRWEVVGVILTLAGLIAINLSNWDSIFDNIRDRFVDRATFAERMRKASEFCLCFCYEAEVLNDLYVCFMYEDLVLVECLKGDAHYATWQRTGEVCDAIVALGLHQGNRVNAETPFFLAELRKKMFISAYGRDKQIATFLGRPPRLSYRYCKMEPPLDLSDEQLWLQGPELDAHLSQLDSNGWNTSGNLCRNTWLRVWFQHCRIREDILEIALGSEEEDVSYKSEQIHLELQRLHASYPAFMSVTPEETLNSSDVQVGPGFGFARSEKNMRQLNALFTICIHAGIAHTEFLLQRAMINRRNAGYKELIPISRKILKLVLLAQSRRDFFRDFQGDLIYLVRNSPQTLTYRPTNREPTVHRPRPPHRRRPRHRTPQTRAIPPIHAPPPPPLRNHPRPQRLRLGPRHRRAGGGQLPHLRPGPAGAEARVGSDSESAGRAAEQCRGSWEWEWE